MLEVVQYILVKKFQNKIINTSLIFLSFGRIWQKHFHIFIFNLYLLIWNSSMNLDAVWHNFWYGIFLDKPALFVIRFSNLFLFKLTLNILCYMITNPFILNLNSTFDQNSSFLREHSLSVVSSYRMKHRVCTIIIQVQKFKFRYSEKATKIWPIFHFLFDIT